MTQCPDCSVQAAFVRQYHLLRPRIMSDTTDCPAGDLQRVPGLFRRWELQNLLEPDRRYHLEDAGTHADGTPLLAVYADQSGEFRPVLPADRSDERDAHPRTSLAPASVTEQFIGQRELADRWNVSPRTLERWRRLRQGPAYLKLRFRVVYDLRHIRAFEANHLRLHTEPPVQSGRREQS